MVRSIRPLALLAVSVLLGTGGYKGYAVLYREGTPPTQAIDWSNPTAAPPSTADPQMNGKLGRVSTGSWVDKGTYVTAPGIPPCDNDVEGARNQFAGQLHEAALFSDIVLTGGAASITLAVLRRVGMLKISEGGALYAWLNPRSGANCHLFIVLIPHNATITGVSYWTNLPNWHKSRFVAVAPEENVEYAWWDKYDSRPVTDKSGNKSQMISAVFRNWSSDHPRLGSIVVAFKIP